MINEGNVYHLLLASMFIGSGGWLFVNRWSKVKHLRDTPTSKVRSAAQGYVELVGMLAGREGVELRAPLSQTPCLWWHYQIHEKSGSGKNTRWRVIEERSSSELLRLLDATGECLIDPRGADVHPAIRQSWSGSTRYPNAPQQTSLLSLLMSGSSYRYVERRLHEGEPLYAIGDFRTLGGVELAPDVNLSEGAIIREWKADYPQLVQRFDTNGDGKLDNQEWEQVQVAAATAAQARRQQLDALPTSHRLSKPATDQPFVLSSHGEDALSRRLIWEALGGGVLCVAGALMGAYVLNW